MFQKVQKEHILQGIKDFEKQGYPNEFGPSSTYDLVVGGKEYPPKAIMAYANFRASGRKIERYFKGGVGTDCFKKFEELGFEVVKKKDPVLEMIERYKFHISKSKLEDEVYKWEIVHKFQGRPDTKATDFTEEIKGIKFQNLIYQLASGVINHIAREKPEELRNAFIKLHDSNTPVAERVKQFDDTTLKLYRDMGQDKNHHQDERTIAFYLTLYNQKKYTIYKNSVYKAYCNLIGVKPVKAGEKLMHYLSLVDEFVEKYIENDHELIHQVQSYIPQYYDGKNHKLLAQDIFYQMLDQKREVKMNSLQQDFVKWLANNPKQDYFNNDHDKISEALDKYNEFFELDIFHCDESNYLEVMDFLNEEIYNNEEGDFFQYSKSTSSHLPRAILGKRNYFRFLKEQFADSRNPVSDEYSNISLNTILYGPPGTGKTYGSINHALSIIEGKSLNQIRTEERTKVKRRYDEYVKKGQIVFTTFHQSLSYEDFVEGIKPVIEQSAEDEAKKDLLYEVQDGILKEMVEKIESDEKSQPNDQQSYYLSPELFTKNINKISLGNTQIASDIAIYNYCVANNCISIGFGQGINFSGVKNRAEIHKRYKEEGIEITNSMDFSISAIERFVLWMEPGQLVFVSNGTRKLKAIGEVVGEYEYKEVPQISFTHFREVKWHYVDLDIPIKQIQEKLFSQQSIYQIAPDNIDYSFFSGESDTAVNSGEPYVLIIDEINRGNVSSIFGELITLLETDKRKGNKEALSISLPYSQTKFSLPNNLYVLGTMNTADRSVEALDTALRRRFSFIEMMPNPELLDRDFEGVDLQEVLRIINHRVELLVDRDHTIGHSYFLNLKNLEDLANAFNDKIIPLLQEYFYGDYGKIGLVLGGGFVEEQSNKDKKFSAFKYDGKSDFITPSYNLKKVDKDSVVDAVSTLLTTD